MSARSRNSVAEVEEEPGEEEHVEDEEVPVGVEPVEPEGACSFPAFDPDVPDDNELDRREHECDLAEAVEKRDLKAIAITKEHWLTHLPKNPYCQSCQEAEMKQAYSKRGAFAREPSKFGGTVTCDHMYTARARMRGFRGEKHALTFKVVHRHDLCLPSRKQVIVTHRWRS
jgi:hypothetical protein